MGQIKNGTNDWSEMDWLAYRIMADIDHYKYWCTPKSTLGPELIKTYFMLNSVEHEILTAHKYKHIKTFGFFR